MSAITRVLASEATDSNYVNADHTHFVDLSSTIAAAISLVFCAFVLFFALYIWRHKQARVHLDRISFRLSLWAMAAQIIQDIVYITLYAPTGLVNSRNSSCGVGVLFRLAMVGIVNYLFTCVAINLLVTIVFGLNPVELRLERYYVGGSLFLGLFIPMVPACLKHFGWDPVFETCYFTSSDRRTRVWHFIVDLYLWQSLSCIIATVCVIAVLIKLFLSSRATSRLLSFEYVSTSTNTSTLPEEKRVSSSFAITRFFAKRRSRSRSPNPCSSDTNPPPSVAMYQLQDKLKGIALRISLYPIALILVNTIVTVGDLHTAVNQGIHTPQAYHLVVFHRLLCGGRGVIFACLCLFVDPCLFRGLKAIFEGRQAEKEEKRQTKVDSTCTSNSSFGKEKKTPSPETPSSLPVVNYIPSFSPFHDQMDSVDPLSGPSSPLTFCSSGVKPASIALNLPTVVPSGEDNGRQGSEASMDFFQALAGPPPQRGTGFASTTSSEMATTPGSAARESRTPSAETDPGHESFGFASHSEPSLKERRSTDATSAQLSQRDRVPSTVSMGLHTILAYSPSRLGSVVSMDLDTALSLPPPSQPIQPVLPTQNSFTCQTSAAAFPGVSGYTSGPVSPIPGSPFTPGATAAETPSSYFEMNSLLPNNSARRPSLPRRWKEAFQQEEVPRVNGREGTVDLERGVGRIETRREARHQRGYLRSLERLYEEAESQL